jgi:hypothetical protein
MIEEARIEYDEQETTVEKVIVGPTRMCISPVKKVIVDNVEILDITLGLYGNVFVRVKDMDGYEYAGELTEVMEDEE